MTKQVLFGFAVKNIIVGLFIIVSFISDIIDSVIVIQIVIVYF